MTLNPEQQRAVETTEGPLLIVAGAGAGKTRVITNRIMHLIHEGVAPRSILAITFTNKSAKEMKERVNHLLAEDKAVNRPISNYEQPFVSTFHALGVHIIREHAGLLGLNRHFTIYDRSDSKRAVKEAMEQSSVDPKKFEPSMILNKISRAKGDGINQLEYFDQARDFMEEMIAGVWEKYDAILTKERALDFDDLLLKTMNLLQKEPLVRAHYQNLWKYIHVDEYQDTNRVQYRIVKSLAELHKNICVVGDADQNIYSWRGATIENILNFEQDYPDATVILLEKNYRSTKIILLAANAIIEKNRLRKKKNLYTDNTHGEKISLMVSYTENDEARAIAETARMIIESGVSAREIAVLYRANFQSRAIEDAFIKKNIPYQLVGTRFFERKEVKDVLSYIRASLNRDTSMTNNESWGDVARIINVPPRGIGKVTVAKVIGGQESSLPPAMKVKIAGFWKLLDDIKHEIMEKKPSEAVKFVIQETGIERALREGDSEDEERLLNVRELVSVAAQYDDYEQEDAPRAPSSLRPAELAPEIKGLRQNEPMPRGFLSEPMISSRSDSPRPREEGASFASPSGIEKLLENAALATDQDDLQKNEDAVKLMTVHASKGLEFENVFIAGLEQDLFPYKRLDEGGTDEAEAEEERRLFYVALTRAKKKVYLSYAVIRTVYGAQRVNAPSEFISDIQADLIEEHQPNKPSGAKAIFIDF